MTKTERIAALEAKVAALEARTTATEAAAFRRLMQPLNPWWPGYWYGGIYGNTAISCGPLTTGSTANQGITATDGSTYIRYDGQAAYSNGTNMVSQ